MRAAALGLAGALPSSQPARASVYLYPGRWVAVREPTSITTILGTCVAVCLFDVAAGVAGMNHYLLARGGEPRERSGRFGEAAIPLLLEEVLALGAARERLQAKVFGGMVRSEPEMITARSIGSANVSLALNHLAEARIPVLAHDVLGARGRKLLFHTDTGDAWVRAI